MMTTTIPAARPVFDYLTDPAHGFDVTVIAGLGEHPDVARFSHRFGRVVLGVDIRADGQVWITHFGRPNFWRVTYTGVGAHAVPAEVIVACIAAALTYCER